MVVVQRGQEIMRELLIYLVVLSALLGCDTRRHIYQDGWVTIEYTLHWDELESASKGNETEPNGATLAIFPVESYLDEPIFKQTNYSTGEIALPVGIYNIVVFNETVNGHDYIEFTGRESYEGFEAHWEMQSVAEEYSRSGSSDMVIETDDFLLVERIEGFEVSYDMLEVESPPHLDFTPEVVNHKMNVLVHIKGLENVSSVRSSLLYMEGMAWGYDMSTGEPTQSKVTHLTNLTDRLYNDGSQSEGTMSASFYTFGDASPESRADDDNVVRLSFALRDETTRGEYFGAVGAVGG